MPLFRGSIDIESGALAEWLRRRTANSVLSEGMGSNPIGVESTNEAGGFIFCRSVQACRHKLALHSGPQIFSPISFTPQLAWIRMRPMAAAGTASLLLCLLKFVKPSVQVSMPVSSRSPLKLVLLALLHSATPRSFRGACVCCDSLCESHLLTSDSAH